MKALTLGAVFILAGTESLESLDRALVRAETRVLALEAQRQELAATLAELEAAQAAARLHADQAVAALQVRIRALSRMPSLSRLRLLSTSTSLEELVQSRRVLKRIAAHDQALHQAFVSEERRLATLAQEATQKKEALLALMEEQRGLRDDIARKRQERLEVVQALLTQPQAAVAAREAGASALKASLAKLKPLSGTTSLGKGKGQLPWPAVGPVKTRFGERVELGYGTLTTHNGWDIAARSGDVVQAIAPGTVVFVDLLPGYGQVVIVDHGDAYHTVAAHLGSVRVAVGDRVSAGGPLGTVGDTGSLRGTLLYFEIRHRGEPQDPAAFLRR